MKARRAVKLAKASPSGGFSRSRLAELVRNASGRRAPVIGVARPVAIDGQMDGEPALGRVENLRVADDTLIGDLVGLPDWFEAALPEMFERTLRVDNGDEPVLTAVKVLGVDLPEIHSLEDLERFVSDKGPAFIAASGPDNNGRDFTVVLASNDQRKVKTMDRKLMRQAFGMPADSTDGQLDERIRAFARQGAKKTPVKASAPDNRPATEVIQAAAAEGKIHERRIPVWVERYEADPAKTRDELSRVTAIDPKLLASARALAACDGTAGDDLHQRTRRALGLDPSSTNDPLAGRPAPTQSPSRVAASSGSSSAEPVGLTRTPDGQVVWGGAPTRLSDRATRQVFYRTGWIDVDEAVRMGLTPSDSAISVHTAQQLGSPKTRAALNEGLSEARQALLGGAGTVQSASGGGYAA
jgi:hypothetical protein